jgi:hypothetical protein
MAGGKMRTNHGSACLQALEGMLQVAMADCRGSDHQRAIGNCLGHRFVLLGAGQHCGRSHSGTGAFKCHIVGINYTQVLKTKVAHGPSGRADVERIARIHQNDAQMIEFSRNRQAGFILRQPGLNWFGSGSRRSPPGKRRAVRPCRPSSHM